MNLNDLLQTVRSSSATDWRKINQSGPIEPPMFHSSSNAESITVDVTTHSEQAIFVPDVNISLAWGLDVDYRDPLNDRGPRRKYDWAEAFVNPDVTLLYVDVRWIGTLVHREMAALVDGAHSYIPVPSFAGKNDDGSTRYEVSSDEVALVGLIAKLANADSTEQTLESLDVTIV